MDQEANTTLFTRAHTPPPSLPSWNSIRINTTTSPNSSSSRSPSISPIATSPIFSNASPYSPHSKMLWQLSQSEPSLVPDVFPSDAVPLDLTRALPGPSSSSGKERRRNTLHMDISISKLGHTRAVSDDDPILTLGDSSLDTERADDDRRDEVVIVDEDGERRLRGRSHLRILGDERSSPIPHSPDADHEERRKEPLHAPLHLACISQSDSVCPHGSNCPFSHVHKRPPSAHISLLSSPAFSPPPSKLHSRVSSLLPSISLDAAVASKPKESTQPRPDSEDWVPVHQKHLSSSSNQPSTLDWLAESHSRSKVLRQPSPRRARTPKYDALGLPLHPLVPQMDISQYRRFKRTHHSAGSNRSIDSALSGAESEERSDSGRSRGRRSRRGSMVLGGKYAVPEVPPFKASRSDTPSIEAKPDLKSSIREPTQQEILYESPPPTIPVSSAMQSRVETPSSQSSVEMPLSNLDIERAILKEPFRKPQEGPPIIPESTGASSSATRKSSGRTIFMMGIQALSSNASSGIGSASKSSMPAFTFPAPDKDRAPLKIAADAPTASILGGFGSQSLFIDPNRPRHAASNTSGDSATQEPTSPTFSTQSGSSRSTKSADPISLFSGPSFTDPMRPLFSGYNRLVATSADGPTPTPVGMRHRGAEWVKRQQGKDLRQAQRLEKALEEKRQTLKQKLDWRPPLVEEPGYGYGDGKQVPVEVTLDTGEVMKVLSEEERRTMEKELERTEASLERVRQEIVEHSGGLSSQLTSPSASESSRLPPVLSTLQSPPSMNFLPLSNLGLGPLKEDKPDVGMASKSPQMMSARERVMARNRLLKSNADLFGDAPSAGTSSTQGRPEVVVRKSANILDFGLFNSPSRLELESGRNIGGASAKSLMGDWPMRQETKTESKAGLNAHSSLSQSIVSEERSTTTNAPEHLDAEDADPELEKAIQRNWSMSPVPPPRDISAAAIHLPVDPRSQKKPSVEVSDQEQPRPRPQSQVPESVQQKRRISMSTAMPGEDASVQTMQGLSFDDSDDDEDGEADDSREYLSAEEGYETANDETPDTVDEEIIEPPPKPVEAEPLRPLLQRKRSSTTTGLGPPSSETKAKSSLLDDWSFNFVSRSTRDVVSPGSYPSTMSTSGTSTIGAHSTPSSRSHLRKLSQDSAYSSSTPIVAHGAVPPNNTPMSPPPQRPVQMSPIPSRAFESQQMAAFPSLYPYSEPANVSHPASPSDSQPVFDEPYFVVKRSANVLDEAANVIQYATARVMSGGVKIGSIQPRGDNGVIPEEDENEEDMEAVFETSDSVGGLEMVTGPPVTTPAAAFSPPHTQYATLPPPVSPVPPYPMGVPVPGQLNVISVPAPAPILAPSQQIPQAVAPVIAMPNAIPISHAPVLLSQPLSVAIAAQPHPRASIVSHATGQSSTTAATTPQSQPIEYCGDYRTTGHCRFGSRCRYSHDVEPRVKTSRNASSAIYRPSVASTNVPPSPVDPLPPVPPGYNLSNVFPQPHHIPGVPLSQQPHSPFVFAPSSSVAHPLTAPSATAAADRGVVMSDKEKATKILKSLGMNPQQVMSHRPAPVVMADGEVRYDMTRKRSVNPDRPDHSPSRPKPPSRVNSVDVVRGQELPHTRVGTPRDSQPVMGSSAGMVMEGEEEDIWTVSSGRQKRPSLTSSMARDGDRGNRRPSEREYLYQSDAQNRAYSPMNPPPSYSPAQPMHHPQHYPHIPPTQQHPTSHYHPPPLMSHNAPTVVHPAQSTPNPAQATLTQEEVFKVLAALGINVSGGPPSTSIQSVPPAYGTQQAPSSYIQQAPGHGNYPGPYNYAPQHPPY